MEDLSGYEPIPGSHQVILPGATETGAADPRLNIEVTVKLRGKRPLPDLSGPPAEPISREQLAAEYGASRQDIDAVVQFYTHLGLKNTYIDAATRIVKFSGPVAEMEKAFRVQLFDYTHPEGNYRGRIGCIYIPKQLSGVVEGVFGLDDPPIRHRTI